MSSEENGTAAPLPCDLDRLVGDLRQMRERWRRAHRQNMQIGTHGFPSRKIIGQIVGDLRSALFPMRLGSGALSEGGEDRYVGHTLDKALKALLNSGPP